METIFTARILSILEMGVVVGLRIKIVGCLDVVVEDPEKVLKVLLLGLDSCQSTRIYIEEVTPPEASQGGSTP